MEETPEIVDVNGTILKVGDVVIKGGYHGGISMGVVRGFKKAEGTWDKRWYVAVDVADEKTHYYDPVNHRSAITSYGHMYDVSRVETTFRGWRRCAWKNASQNIMKISEITEASLIEKYKIGTYETVWSSYIPSQDPLRPFGGSREETPIASGTTPVEVKPV